MKLVDMLPAGLLLPLKYKQQLRITSPFAQNVRVCGWWYARFLWRCYFLILGDLRSSSDLGRQTRNMFLMCTSLLQIKALQAHWTSTSAAS